MSQTKQRDQNGLFTRPLNVLSLPPDILVTLVPHEQSYLTQTSDEPASHIPALEPTLTEGGQPTCAACGNLVFEDVRHQRDHFRLDWHRFNVKRRVLNPDLKPVSEAEFDEMVADLTDSLSGSESTISTASTASTSSSSSSIDKISTLVAKYTIPTAETSDQLSKNKNSSPLIYFTTPLTQTPTALGIYRVLISRTSEPLDGLKKIQVAKNENKTWAMFMLGGGHFEGAIIDVGKSVTKLLAGEKNISTIISKGFHRYTTRRKQGGAQSASDNAKGKSRSAGAQIRRYNENALKQEIRELLNQWRQHIQAADYIFVHAPSANKKIIFGYEGAVLEKGDPRIRAFPFSTRRPTLSEIKRSFIELTTLKVSNLLQSTLNALDQKQPAATSQLTTPKKDISARPKTEDPPLDEALEKLINLTIKGKTDVVMTHITKHPHLNEYLKGRELTTSKETDNVKYPTLLHLAATNDQSLMVAYLLEQGADPTFTTELQPKTAYELSHDKETRNCFRRAMAEFPEKWDWHMAKVPSGLTKEMEEEQARKELAKKEKEKERKKAQKKEKKEKEKEKEEQVDETLKTSATNPLLDTTKMLNEISLAKLSPEMRMKIEREKRAKAAEMRIANMKIGGSSMKSEVKCEMCGKTIEGMPFERLNFKYCSTACVAKHRAEAS